MIRALPNDCSIYELKNFIDSLDEELKVAKFDFQLLEKAEFLAIERFDNQIAGVTGIYKSKIHIPILFIVVSKYFQGKKLPIS